MLESETRILLLMMAAAESLLQGRITTRGRGSLLIAGRLGWSKLAPRADPKGLMDARCDEWLHCHPEA